MPSVRVVVLALLALAGLPACSSNPSTSPSAGLARATLPGSMIYAGEVTPLGHESPRFHYERHVGANGALLASVHRTSDSASQAVVVEQRAVHTHDYELVEFEEQHGQTGVRSGVVVQPDGALSFTVERGGRTRTRVEKASELPVVVGPTLFGFVLARWDALLRGEEQTVRFAITDRARSYPFVLRVSASDERRTTIEMVASQALVRMAVPTMELEFDTDSRRIVSYTGRVPPRIAGRPIDAHVDYTFFAAQYR